MNDVAVAEAFTAPSYETYQLIELGKLVESATNPRTYFDKEYLKGLAESIKTHGLIQPIVVRRVQQNMKEDSFEIVAGACRARAAKIANLPEIPAIIRQLGDEEVLEIQIVENLQRKDIHPLEEATGYSRLQKLSGMDVPTIAAKVGKSTSYVYQRMQLDKLIPAAKKAFREEEITAGHAVLIARLQPEAQKEAIYWSTERGDNMGVRELARVIETEIHRDLSRAPWDVKDATLVPEAGSCIACPKRTGSQPDLFADIKKTDTCTDATCFGTKRLQYLQRVKAQLSASNKPFVEISDKYSSSDGIIGGGDYREAKQRCENAVLGLVVDGRELGKQARICTNKRCKTHWHTASDYNPRTGQTRAADLKHQAEKEARRQVVTTVANKVRVLKPDDLRFVAHALLAEMWSDRVKEICQARGLEPVKTKHSYGGATTDYETPVRGLIDETKPAALGALLVELALSGKIAGDHEKGRGAYLSMLKRYKVDKARIEAKLLSELKAKAKAKKKAVQTSAKKAAAKKSVKKKNPSKKKAA